MVTNSSDRIWLLPHKFWSATKQMPQHEAENLLERVASLCEKQDFETLKKFDFIAIGKRPRVANSEGTLDTKTA